MGTRLAIVIPLTVGIIFGVLYLLYRNLKYVYVALACIPLSLVGGIYALLMRGYYFNVSGGVGFISLFGIATMAGVLFVSRTNHLLHEDDEISVREAVKKAAVIQLRPMLMTILLALLGLIPATLASGVGSDVQRPLATVIVGGLFSALLLVLTVLPSLYLILVGERDYVPKRQNLESYSYLDQYPLEEYESEELDISTETKISSNLEKEKKTSDKKTKKKKKS